MKFFGSSALINTLALLTTLFDLYKSIITRDCFDNGICSIAHVKHESNVKLNLIICLFNLLNRLFNLLSEINL